MGEFIQTSRERLRALRVVVDAANASGDYYYVGFVSAGFMAEAIDIAEEAVAELERIVLYSDEA